jgi:hypothetical protein
LCAPELDIPHQVFRIGRFVIHKFEQAFPIDCRQLGVVIFDKRALMGVGGGGILVGLGNNFQLARHIDTQLADGMGGFAVKEVIADDDAIGFVFTGQPDFTKLFPSGSGQHGVKVFTYIQYGTVMPETIQGEEEQAKDWGRTDWNGQHDGHPYEYGDQYWRAKPCANTPGFRDYLLRCVERAIEIGADGIWIDNLQADGCHCPYCQEAFRAFVKKHVKDPWQELGLRPEQLDRITIPRAVRPRDPLFQLWVRCRVEETRTSLEMLCAKARALKPDVVMAANIGIGNHQKHVIENANWHAMLELLDYTYAENGLFPRLDGERIISQHYSYSLGNAVDTCIVPGAAVGNASRGLPRTSVPNDAQLRRCFAESVMYGDHALGGPWGLRGENGGEDPIILRDAPWRATNRRLADFYASKPEWFRGATDASPVAILYSFEALLADEGNYRQAYEAVAQSLMRHQMPFRYLLSDRLEKLDQVSLLILPQVLPLADETAACIRDWVKRGGRVLGTGRCGLYDAGMRQRRDYVLADLFGVHFSNRFEDDNHDTLVRNPETGCVLLPGRWGLKLADGSPACRIPEDRLTAEIRRLLPADIPQIDSPVPSVGCSWSRLADGHYRLGLLNYGNEAVRGLQIRWSADHSIPNSVTVTSVGGSDQTLPVIHTDIFGRHCILPPLNLEAFIIIHA